MNELTCIVQDSFPILAVLSIVIFVLMPKTLKAILLGLTITLFSAQHMVNAAPSKLRIGTEPYYAPFEYLNYSGQLEGFDVDVIAAIAQLYNITLEFTGLEFKDLFVALDANSIDVAISAISYNAQRHAQFDYTRPYFNSGIGAAILDKNQESITKLADLHDKSLCVNTDTSGDAAARKITQNILSFSNMEEAFIALHEGKSEALVADIPTIQYTISQNPEAGFVAMKQLFSREQFGMVEKKGQSRT